MIEGSPLTQARRSRALLQRLTDHGLLHRLERRIGGVYAGSSGYVYGLAVAGQRVTTRRGPAGGVRLRKPWEPSSLFTDHVLAVSELYVRLREAERAAAFELVSFDAEPACWRSWTGFGGEPRIVKPDGFVRLIVGDFEHSSFVEVDRGTESRPVIRRKAEVYIDYWRSGTEQAARGVFPKVVWLVPDEARKAQLVSALEGVPAEFWRLFQVVFDDESVWALSNAAPPAEPVSA